MFRNKEVIKYIAFSVFIIIVVSLVNYTIDKTTFLPVLLSMTAIFVIFILFTRHRYLQIDKLSSYLRSISNGDFRLDVRDNEEGELSILKNEIYKVTITLYEQAQLLSKEKNFLADTLSDISHQIKTPITSISVMIDLLSDENLPVAKRMEFTKNIRSQLERLQWLVSSLLKLSKMDAGTVKFKSDKINVLDLIRKSVEHLLIPMEINNQKLQITGDNRVTYIGDFNWSVEAVANIVKNCMEHTPCGGVIGIDFSENSIYTLIEIWDTGKGILSSDLPYIFKRFYKGKNAQSDSVGIGLAMSKTIFEKQGGHVQAENQISGGAKFEIKIYKHIV